MDFSKEQDTFSEEGEADKARRFGDDDVTPSINQAFREKIRPALDVVDTLRGLDLPQFQDLPSIVVVGDQSVGKSSVLEQISGIQLPRGTGIVTRCPLELRMRQARFGDAWSGSIEYRTKKGELVTHPVEDPSAIGDMVRKAQNDMTGDNKGISDQMISLKVTARDAPDLTLIDLPGIARYTQGSTDVPKMTRDLIKKYIARPDVIILVVIPCHSDVETIEALKLAADVDPEFDRTIGVMTYPDLVNQGAENDVITLVSNMGPVKLKKGFIMVKCRSQADIMANSSLGEALKQEIYFFSGHVHFCELKTYQYGTETLVRRLMSELYEKIRQNLINMSSSILSLMKDIQKEVNDLQGEIPDSREERLKFAFKRVRVYIEAFDMNCNGIERHPDFKYQLMQSWREYSTDFGITVCNFIDPTKNRSLLQALRAMVFHQRMREFPTITDIFALMERIVCNEFLSKVYEPARQLAKQVEAKTSEVVDYLYKKHIAAFPEMQRALQAYIEPLKQEQLVGSLELIDLMFSAERIPYTQDFLFVTVMDSVEARLGTLVFDGHVGDTQKHLSQIQTNRNLPVFGLRQAKIRENSSGAVSRAFDNRLVPSDSNRVKDDLEVFREQMEEAGSSQIQVIREAYRKVCSDEWANKLTNTNAENGACLLKTCIGYLRILAQRMMDYIPILVMKRQLIDMGMKVKDNSFELINRNNVEQMLILDEEVERNVQMKREQLRVMQLAMEHLHLI